jgi:hypothetical protein
VPEGSSVEVVKDGKTVAKVDDTKGATKTVPANPPSASHSAKTHDFLLWLIKHTQRFPKYLRHFFTQRLETAFLDFQEATLMGNAARSGRRPFSDAQGLAIR